MGKPARAETHPAYNAINAASHWLANCHEWHLLILEVIEMPTWMLPAVKAAVRRKAWRHSYDPLKQIRAAAKREAMRSGLMDPKTGGPAGLFLKGSKRIH